MKTRTVFSSAESIKPAILWKGSAKMDQLWRHILVGAAAGAAAAVAARLLCALLLGQRGLRAGMPRAHFWMLLISLAAAGAVIGFRAGMTLRGLYLMLLLCVSAAAFYVDARHRIIPNELVLAIIALAAGFGLIGAIPFRIVSSLLGLAACFVIFFIPGMLGKRIGAGDVKLAAAMGFALGLTGSMYAVVGMGALVLCYILLSGRMRFSELLGQTIPMGPFLTLALVAVSVL